MEYLVENKKETDSRILTKDDFKWTSFLRQIMVVSSAWTLYFCLGLQFGTTTVMVPQLRRANVTVSEEMFSWMTSGVAYAAIPWIVIHNILVNLIGWKKTSIFISIITITGNVIFCFSTTPTILLISDGFFGVTFGATASIYVILISEYTSPQYRGMFLCIKSASYFWGVWLANAIGAFSYWRYIPFVSLFASLHTLTVFVWPESPYWLATKNKFAECRKSHRWLKGNGEKAEAELNRLIESGMESTVNSHTTFKDLKFICERDFYLPLSICMIALLSYHSSGKLVITAYAVDMIKKMIKDEYTVYYTMLILDGITVFSAYVGCFITKVFKRRTIWLTTCSFGIIFLLILALYTYLVKLSVCSENVYFSIFPLIGYSISISCGPLILALSWSGELIPYKYKSMSVTIIALSYMVLQAIFLKVAPLIISTLGLHGTFLFYAISLGICTSLMYFYLPETKDKTLVDIEEYFRENKRKIIVEEGSKLVP